MKSSFNGTWDYLKGKKVYLLCLSWAAYTLLGVYLGKIDPIQAEDTVYKAAVLAAFRHTLATIFSPEFILSTLQQLNQMTQNNPVNKPDQPNNPQV